MDDFNQLMLERQQRVEEAIERAQAGVATEDDWTIIRYECGVVQRTYKPTQGLAPCL
jgi:hypothetical protein